MDTLKTKNQNGNNEISIFKFCIISYNKLKMVEIRLNVYDLTTYNKYLDWMGLGAYHTAICIDGVEYNYGGADSPEPGVY